MNQKQQNKHLAALKACNLALLEGANDIYLQATEVLGLDPENADSGGWAVDYLNGEISLKALRKALSGAKEEEYALAGLLSDEQSKDF